MAALSLQHLKGHNFQRTCAVDCCNVQDVSKTRCIFEFLCPPDMEIITISKSYGNGEQPCGWEVLYAFKAETQRQCNVEDAKNTFQKILKCIPFNVIIKDHDKNIVGMPPRYRIRYTVDTCSCDKLNFDLADSIKKLNVEI